MKFRYLILKDMTLLGICSQVNTAMENGDLPQGGIASARDGGTTYYIQAMIRPVGETDE